jgi:hypothetical protein
MLTQIRARPRIFAGKYMRNVNFTRRHAYAYASTYAQAHAHEYGYKQLHIRTSTCTQAHTRPHAHKHMHTNMDTNNNDPPTPFYNSGKKIFKLCLILDPSPISDRNPFHLSVCPSLRHPLMHQGHIFALGGFDGQKCLATVEQFDLLVPQRGWRRAPSMSIPRRALASGKTNRCITSALVSKRTSQ